MSGLGNTEKSEALYTAGIDPHTNAKQLGTERMSLLDDAIRAVCSERKLTLPSPPIGRTCGAP